MPPASRTLGHALQMVMRQEICHAVTIHRQQSWCPQTCLAGSPADNSSRSVRDCRKHRRTWSSTWTPRLDRQHSADADAADAWLTANSRQRQGGQATWSLPGVQEAARLRGSPTADTGRCCALSGVLWKCVDRLRCASSRLLPMSMREGCSSEASLSLWLLSADDAEWSSLLAALFASSARPVFLEQIVSQDRLRWFLRCLPGVCMVL